MKLKANIAAMEAYVPGKTVPGAVKLSSNENPLGPSPKALDAIREALDGVHRYPDGAAAALKTALTRQWGISRESIMVANGSDEVFMLLAAAWIGPGENAVSARETFSQYRYAVHLFGADIRELPLSEGRFNLEAILEAIDRQTRMVFLCNPNNPTGTYRNHDEIENFLSRMPQDVIVILDEAYAEFADQPDFPDSKALLKKYPHLVVTRTFSKLYGLAGLRVGYALGNSEIISGADRASMPFNVNNLAQAAALAAIADEKHRNATLNLVQTEKAFFSAELNQRNIFYYPTQANFICFRLDAPIADLWTPIASRGIALRDLKSFGLPQMARYTFGTRKNNIHLLEILDEVADK
ncbi:MAG: histidinol-phosphate transaminase [Spirochaetaceae bacterium]|nr:histidinol-phosphate transaminase [Spirochaetaceae bacterium]